jgi:hypothetical protein
MNHEPDGHRDETDSVRPTEIFTEIYPRQFTEYLVTS